MFFRVAVASTAIGCVASSEDGGVDRSSSPVVSGVQDDGDLAVVALMRGDEVVCSGTIVSPTLVVTAAHCLVLAPIERVVVGSDPSRPSETLRVDESAIDPAYDPSASTHDVGVVFLRDAATIVGSRIDDDAPAIDATVRIVGFGLTRATDPSTHTKHTGFSVVSRVDANAFDLASSPSGGCTGDSGGAIFAQVDGVDRWIGVVSGGDASCNERTRAIRLDAERAFLAPIVDASSADFHGSCAWSAPPARSLPLAGLALALLLARRRKG